MGLSVVTSANSTQLLRRDVSVLTSGNLRVDHTFGSNVCEPALCVARSVLTSANLKDDKHQWSHSDKHVEKDLA